MNNQTTSGADVQDWRPEDERFWASTGKISSRLINPIHEHARMIGDSFLSC